VSPTVLLMDSAGSLLYAMNQSSATISVYSISSSDGTLTEIAGSPFPANQSPVAMALSASGNLLFVANANLAGVSVFTVSSGALQIVPGSPFPVGHAPLAWRWRPREIFCTLPTLPTAPYR